jgi:hypothetical protein
VGAWHEIGRRLAALRRHAHLQPPVERPRVRREHCRARRRRALGQSRSDEQQHPASHGVRDRGADPNRMRGERVPLHRREDVAPDRLRRVRAVAGVDGVDGLARRQPVEQSGATLGYGRTCCDRHAAAVVDDGLVVAQGQRRRSEPDETPVSHRRRSPHAR